MQAAELKLAKSAGFCFGVNRAVEIVLDLLKKGEAVYTLGPIIHNPQMVEDLRRRGAEIAEDPEDVPKGAVLVIRSHGVPESVIERLEALGVRYIDATCPFVSKIHRIVKIASTNGETVLIAGDKTHPEVLGIRGHCKGSSLVFKDEDDLQEIFDSNPQFFNEKLTIVAQTTYSTKIWQNCYEKIIEKGFSNATFFDTICNATAERQREAVNLSQSSDLMIIIGGRSSSNTAKLRDVCAPYCKTCLIETALELPQDILNGVKKVGITAGASTPAGIIKEVLTTMSENINKELDENFEELLEESFKNANTNGKVVLGTVERIASGEAYVDVGRKQFGIIRLSDLTDDPNLSVEDVVKVGDKIDLVILKTNDQDGIMYLSKKLADIPKAWASVRSALETDDVLEGIVTKVVKGGLTISFNNLRVFVPRSMASIERDADLEALVKKTVKFKIKEINDEKRSIIGSIREVLSIERKEKEEKFWSQAEVGQAYAGIVKSLTSYGAFVDIGGVDGMIHISELSWERIKTPSEIVKVGDVVNVYIKNLDLEKKKISLGYKDPDANPWGKLEKEFPIGSVVEGKVVNLAPFGAFVNILPSIDGLVHISQIADKHIEKPQDILKVGQIVRAILTDVNLEKRRVSLSIRELLKQESDESDAEALAEVPELVEAEELAIEASAPIVAEEAVVEAEAPAEEVAVEAAPAAEEAAE
ncbi:MAG: bifunctional 4-hydroxy-3-methylbut-2-enyl diphosphate reductase/30S ribosomal protein S1 [Oscillospiraceae bacterium]|nr:bifunctional 4-hydroxy-3-methylbut-2-enyl diphosphate reductase/30S ribosomal protein S1 [Oscillospiraceae bacterium]